MDENLTLELEDILKDWTEVNKLEDERKLALDVNRINRLVSTGEISAYEFIAEGLAHKNFLPNALSTAIAIK